MSNLDPQMNYDDAAWEQQNANKMTPDALTPPYQAQGFGSQEAYNAANGYQPSSIYGTPNYGSFDNSSSAINQSLAGNNSSSVNYSDWSMMDPAQQTATGAAQALAAEFGLQSLAPKIVDWVLKGGITDANVLFQNISATPEFKAAYPEIAQRQAAGKPPVSPAQILSNRQAYAEALQKNGIDPSYVTPQQMSQWIVDDVSPTEVDSRLTNTYQKLQNDPGALQQMQYLYGQGMSPGEVVAWALDPTHSEAYHAKQEMAASIAARANQTGFGQLNQGQAEGLAGLGVTDTQALQGFGQLGQQRGLFEQGINESSGLSNDVGLQAQFYNNGQAQQQLQRRLQERTASTSGGGNFADPNKSGTTGAGVSNT